MLKLQVCVAIFIFRVFVLGKEKMIIMKIEANYNNGNAVNRVYRRVRRMRNSAVVLAAVDFSVATMMAKMHQALPTVIMGGVTCMMINRTNKCNKLLKIVQPFYHEIVARAQRIYSKK